MILSFVLMGLLALGAIASVVIPLWRQPKQASLVASESNLAVWRQEREEILRDAQNARWSDSEREAALNDLSERAAREMGSAPGERTIQRRPARALAIVLGAAVLALSVLLYGRLGNLDLLSAQPGAQARTGEGSVGPADPRVLAMVDSLTKKLKDNPQDLQGWTLLARSQMVLDHYPQAAEAYQHAVQLSPPDAQLLADYADALAMSQGRSLEGRPSELVMQAVQIDPTNMKALELAGTIAVSHGDAQGALDYWGKLRALLPAGSDDAREVDQALATLRSRAGGAQSQSGAQSAPQSASQTASAAPATGISGRIDIQPDLAGKVALNDTVYVYARAVNWNTGGPRMPLAVLKFSARELPRSFSLTDAQAMTPAAKLSSLPEVLVQARVSKSGQALPQAGDLQSAAQTVKSGAQSVVITIDQVVK